MSVVGKKKRYITPVQQSTPRPAGSQPIFHPSLDEDRICTDHGKTDVQHEGKCLFLSFFICIILSDTSKASENLTFIQNRSVTLSSICVVVDHRILAGCHENQRLGRRNDISFRFARVTPGSDCW